MMMQNIQISLRLPELTQYLITIPDKFLSLIYSRQFSLHLQHLVQKGQVWLYRWSIHVGVF